MQQYRDQVEEEQNHTNGRLCKPEDENHRQTSMARVKAKVIEEADARFQDALTLSSNKASALQTELTSVMRSLMDTKKELAIREQKMESLNSELQKAKVLELKLAEKEASINTLKEEIGSLTQKASEANTSKEKIQEMEAELGKRNEVETSLYESLKTQTKQLGETKILLAESKLEIDSLRKKLEKLEGSSSKNNGSLDHRSTQQEPVQNLNEQVKLRSAEDQSSRSITRIDGKLSLSESQTKNLLEEMEALKNELKLATEAEENSKKAMDDLALALKEVATETKQAKEKLTVSELELEHTKEEADRLRVMLRSTEDHYKELVDESRKEADIYKNTAERLRSEAEESLVAWNEKERELVNCIKRIEEENAANQQEVDELLHSLATSENMAAAAKEENQKLRDILKQALNEANVSKEAARIATAENSTLKDTLEERERGIEMLTKEIDLLKINEAAYLENIKELKRMMSETSSKELKRMMSETSSKELKKEDKEKPKDSKEAGKRNKSHNSFDHKEFKVMACGLHVKEVKVPYKHSKSGSIHVEHEPLPEIETESALGGSVFENGHSPNSDPDAENAFSDEFEHLEEIQLDDPKKKKALFKRVGDIIMMRRSFHRKESSLDLHNH